MVIVEQADGLYELERNRDREWGDIEATFHGLAGRARVDQFTKAATAMAGSRGGAEPDAPGH